MTDEVISITPDGQVLTFENLAKARGTLLDRYHKYIIASEEDLLKKMNLDDMKAWYRRFGISIREFCRTEKSYNVPHEFRISDAHAAKFMWPIFITQGRKTVARIKSQYGAPAKTKGGRKWSTLYCRYVPGEDPVMDRLYVRQTKQFRTLVDLLVENASDPDGLPDYRWYKLVVESKERLRTKQEPFNIYRYYAKRLLGLGFLETKVPDGRKY
jgi:hypothetical protein